MNAPTAFAYSLRETEQGWRWHVVDRDGNTIDAGLAPDKISARAAIRRVRGAGGGAIALAARPAGWRDFWRNFVRACRALFHVTRLG